MYAENSKVVKFNSVAKLPPQNVEAEEEVLGGILMDPGAIAVAVGRGLKPAHFYVKAHERIYAAALQLRAAERPIDLMNMATFLADTNQLEIIGGRSKLTRLVDATVTSINVDNLADLVIAKWKRRELGRIAQIAFEAQFKSDEELGLDDVIRNLHEELDSVNAGQVGGVQHISEVAVDLFEDIEKRSRGEVEAGVKTGYYDLDNLFGGGVGKSELVVVAARPAMGKSAFAAQMGVSVAKATNLPVAVFSLEMSKKQIALRSLSQESEVEANYLKSGRISDGQWESILEGINNLSELPVYLDDKADPSVSYIETQCRNIMRKHQSGMGMIVVDYLQLMDGDAGQNRNNEIAKLTRGLKKLAMKLGCPIVCLSQLSRAVESRNNKRPVLSDLRDSGGIEQDADKVIMLYREEYYTPDTQDRAIAEIIVAKNREGSTGTVKLLFNAPLVQFRNMAR